MTKPIESKLPEDLKKELLVYAADRRNSVAQENRFDHLLAFLREQENIYCMNSSSNPGRRETRIEPRHARNKSAKSSNDPAHCVICDVRKHMRKLYFCSNISGEESCREKVGSMQEMSGGP